MKRLTIPIFGLCVLCLAIALHEVILGSREATELTRRPSGAMEALDFWAAARAYPGRTIPDVGHAAAFLAAQRQPLRGTGVDAAVAPWSSLGPENIGGRTLALALHPANPDVIYAGSASGGLWKSTTGGVGADAWECVDTGHPVLAVSTIAIDATDPDVHLSG